MKIKVKYKYGLGVFGMEKAINKALKPFDIEIDLEYYDDNRVYRTGERSLDSRLDCRNSRFEAAY